MKTISNEQLTIQVSPHGAELCSIFANGKEYLWQADPAFWKRHSPVLFPIVGSVWENQYRNEGIAYTSVSYTHLDVYKRQGRPPTHLAS